MLIESTSEYLIRIAKAGEKTVTVADKKDIGQKIAMQNQLLTALTETPSLRRKDNSGRIIEEEELEVEAEEIQEEEDVEEETSEEEEEGARFVP